MNPIKRYWIRMAEWTMGPFSCPNEAGHHWPRQEPGVIRVDGPQLYVEKDWGGEWGMGLAPSGEYHAAWGVKNRRVRNHPHHQAA